MGILVNTGFDVGSSNPVDSRTVKNTIDERDALVIDGLVYENLKVYCKDTQTEYRWTGTDWEEVGTGGTVDLSEYTKTYTSLDELELTADATVDDVLSKLQPGETFTAGVTQFTNYQTLFPYESSNDQYSRVFIQQGSSLATAYVKWFRKDGSREALANLNSNNKVAGWNEHTMNEIIHTTLSESLSGITTTLDLINALITEYRAKGKPVRFISGALTKTQLTDLPSNYGLLDITVAGYDLVEVRFSQSDFGFEKMYFGYLSRTSSENLFSSLIWGEVNTSTKTLVTNTTTLKLDVTKRNSAWYGAVKLTYLYDTSPVEVEITFKSATDNLGWAIINGQKYIKKITFTQDSSNTAHYTIGIEFSGTTYGCYQAEVIGGFADINSLTSESFTGEKTAVYYSPWGKNNGVTLVSAPEDLGLTFPCTSVQLAQAMRNKFNKTINAGAIGVFNCGGKTTTITDAPSDYGLLHIEVFGHDRMLIRYDGIAGSCYAGSWIGQIQGNNGTFSGITWSRIDNDTRVTTLETQVSNLTQNGNRINTLETQVNELFQSVSSGKTAVANAITDKGIYTSATATFATIATNIGKIPETITWKEETVSASVNQDSHIARFVFSNNVLGVKQITAPGYHYTAETQETKMFTINNNIVEVYFADGGTWKMTALVQLV